MSTVTRTLHCMVEVHGLLLHNTPRTVWSPQWREAMLAMANEAGVALETMPAKLRASILAAWSSVPLARLPAPRHAMPDTRVAPRDVVCCEPTEAQVRAAASGTALLAPRPHWQQWLKDTQRRGGGSSSNNNSGAADDRAVTAQCADLIQEALHSTPAPPHTTCGGGSWAAVQQHPCIVAAQFVPAVDMQRHPLLQRMQDLVDAAAKHAIAVRMHAHRSRLATVLQTVLRHQQPQQDDASSDGKEALRVMDVAPPVHVRGVAAPPVAQWLRDQAGGGGVIAAEAARRLQKHLVQPTFCADMALAQPTQQDWHTL